MRALEVLCVLQAVLVSSASVSSPDPSLVSYQSHSHNALANLRQAIAKGSRWFKVDPHFMTADFCAKWNSSLPAPNGCLLLSHDSPEAQYPYNTTEELLSFLVDLLQAGVFRDDDVYVAWCFKYDYGNPCSGDQLANQQAKDWATLVDGLYAKCNTISQSFPTIHWVMDGAGTSGGSERSCLVGRWPLWPATWIFGSDPIEALDSNDKTAGYDRFQINNMEEGNPSSPASPLDTLRAHNPPFGKFLGSSAPEFPFLLWEPDRQTEILDIASNYLKGPLAPGGFRFAANIDPVQLGIYAARAGAGSDSLPWNYHLKGLNNASLTDAPMVTSPSNQPSYFQAQKGRPVIISWREYDIFVVQVCRVLNTKLSCRPAQQIKDQSPYIEFFSSVTVKSADTFQDVVMAGDDAGYYTLYRVGDDDSLVNLGSGGFYENRSAMSLVTSPDLLNVSVVHIFSNYSDDCALSFAVHALKWQGDKLVVDESPVPPRDESGPCSVPPLRQVSKCALPRSLLPSRFAFIAATSISATGVGCGRQAMGLYGVEVGVNTSPPTPSMLFANVFLVDDPSKGDNAQVSLQSPTQIGLGKFPSVSVAGTYEGPMGAHPAVFVAGESYCYNSHEHNTRSFPGMCQQQPATTPSVMTYTLADLIDWSNLLNVQSSNGKNFINSCTPHFQHGMYDMGSSPSTSLFIDQQQIGVAAVHRGISNTTTDVGGCGLAESYDGIVLDGWITTNA